MIGEIVGTLVGLVGLLTLIGAAGNVKQEDGTIWRLSLAFGWLILSTGVVLLVHSRVIGGEVAGGLQLGLLLGLAHYSLIQRDEDKRTS